MIPDEVIELSPPAMELVEDFHDALVESYNEHKQFLTWAERNRNIETTRENMAEAISKFEQCKGELRFIVTRKSDGRVVGCIGLLIQNMAIPYLEIGYWVRSSESGKGYTSKAVELIEKYATSKLCVKRLEIKMAASNYASRKVAKKSGFEHEATLKLDRMLPSGKIDNTYIYSKIFS